MKYFPPERYLALGNLRERQAFLAAHDDWERAIKGYKDRLRKIRSDLPAALRQMVESIYLHDARVLDMWHGQRSRFTITLHPESDPSRLVVLVYSLKEPPTIDQDALPTEARSTPVAWLYDELDVERPNSHRTKPLDRRPLLYTHNILLSNGWEVRLRFRQVTISRPVSLIPATQKPLVMHQLVSHSA
jgi:hypothetical protein